MGTINYGTSDYITMGTRPVDCWEVEHDAELMKELQEEVNEYGGTIEEAINNYIQEIEEGDYYIAEEIMERYSFYYYHVVLKLGYYSGCYVDIENNFSVCYDDYIEKAEAQKEITQLKKMLIELADVGFVSVLPGWVTTYKNYNDTLLDISDAIKEARAEAKFIPTYTQYERSIA